MFRFASMLIASLISLNFSNAWAANKGPADLTVQNEIVRKNYFNVSFDGISPKEDRAPSSTTKLADGSSLLEWATGEDVVAATYGNAGLKSEPGVWRLTELDLTKKELTAVTTTFFKNGLRSRTECSGKTQSTLQCATASRNLCEGFKVNMKKYGAQLGLVGGGAGREVTEGVKQKMLAMGEQCSQYASFLDNTLDPNKLMTGTARGNRDDEIVTKDLEAIDQIRKNAKSKALDDAKFKGLSDVMGKGDDVGASTTGMKDRSARMKDIGADFKVLSKLAFTCSDATFVEERPGSNEAISKTPHNGQTRP